VRRAPESLRVSVIGFRVAFHAAPDVFFPAQREKVIVLRVPACQHDSQEAIPAVLRAPLAHLRRYVFRAAIDILRAGIRRVEKYAREPVLYGDAFARHALPRTASDAD